MGREGWRMICSGRRRREESEEMRVGMGMERWGEVRRGEVRGREDICRY